MAIGIVAATYSGANSAAPFAIERQTVPVMMSTGPTAADLARDFGLAVHSLHRHPGGFESDCWVADSVWFVKMWRSRQEPVGLALLNQLAAAGVPVPTPVPTITGQLYVRLAGRPYAVFEMVEGQPPTDEDWPEAALALRHIHDLTGIDLPPTTMDEPEIWQLGKQLDHPWIADRRREVVENIHRLEEVMSRAKAARVEHVVCHRDFGGHNLLINNGKIAAVLDWDQAVLGPREHDVWIAAELTHGASFLTAYNARDLDPDHIEYALLARALRDMAARVLTEQDQPGVETWGFRRIARLERDFDLFRPFCR